MWRVVSSREELDVFLNLLLLSTRGGYWVCEGVQGSPNSRAINKFCGAASRTPFVNGSGLSEGS